ncbi:unnamed protein product [Camellia sinensis]
MTIAADTSGSPTRLQLGSATSGKGDIGNYTGICIIVATLGVADGHVQGGMVGDLSFMCPTFIQSFQAGLAASGALTSALRLMTKQPLKELIMAFAREPMVFDVQMWI